MIYVYGILAARTAADSPRSATSQSSPRVSMYHAQPSLATNDVTESLARYGLVVV